MGGKPSATGAKRQAAYRAKQLGKGAECAELREDAAQFKRQFGMSLADVLGYWSPNEAAKALLAAITEPADRNLLETDSGKRVPDGAANSLSADRNDATPEAGTDGRQQAMKSDKFDNGLEAHQEERLVRLIEECSEVIKAATKTLRHGYESRNPTLRDSKTNRQDLAREINDLRYAISLIEASGDTGRTKGYLHHQDQTSGGAKKPAA